MAGTAVVSVQDANWAMSVVFGLLGVLGAWSVGTFPLGFTIVDEGIKIHRPLGARLIHWYEITRISRMPGPLRIAETSDNRRQVRRQGGTLMLAVGRRRISISSSREPAELRNELIAAARRQGIEVMPTVFSGE